MKVDFFDTVNLILAFQVLLLVLVILQKGYKSISNKLLAFFLFSEALFFLNNVLYNDYQFFANNLPYLFYWTTALTFVWGPTIYLYVMTEIKEITVIKPKHLIHFIPAFGTAIYFLVNFHFLTFDSKVKLLLEDPLLTWENSMFVTFAMILQLVIYNGMSLYKLLLHSKKAKKSTNKNRLRLTLTKIVLIGYIIACIAYNLNIAYLQLSGDFQFSKYITLAIFSAYFIAILYRFLLSNEFVKALPHKLMPGRNMSELTFSEMSQKLEAFMVREKPYLKTGLTLSGLAEKMKVKERSLSQVINDKYGQNFQEYINYFRIDYAKELLLSHEDPKLTVQELVYAVGFNSKTAFYVSFKKLTGLTPLEFKRKKLVHV